MQKAEQVAHIAAPAEIAMVVPERRQEASDEEDEFVSGEEQSGDDEDDKSEFSVSEDEDGAVPHLHALCCQAPAIRQHRPCDCTPGSIHLGLRWHGTSLTWMTLLNADETARQPDTSHVTEAVDDLVAAKAADQTAAGFSGDALSCMDDESAGGGWNDHNLLSRSCVFTRGVSPSAFAPMQRVQMTQQAVPQG